MNLSNSVENRCHALVAIEDKIILIRNEIIKEGKIRNEAIENLNACLENDLPKLSDGIKNESNEREDVDQNIMKKVKIQINIYRQLKSS